MHLLNNQIIGWLWNLQVDADFPNICINSGSLEEAYLSERWKEISIRTTVADQKLLEIETD